MSETLIAINRLSTSPDNKPQLEQELRPVFERGESEFSGPGGVCPNTNISTQPSTQSITAYDRLSGKQ